MDGDLSIYEVAMLFGVSTKTVRRWISRGEVRAYKLPGGRLIRIDVDSISDITRPAVSNRHSTAAPRKSGPRQGFNSFSGYFAFSFARDGARR